MKTCSSCGANNPSGNKFCAECGNSLKETGRSGNDEVITCPNCSSDVPPDFQFCGKCGADVSGKTPKANRKTQQKRSTAGSNRSNRRNRKRQQQESTQVVGKLVVVQPDGTKGPEVPIARGETTIGRSTDRDALSKDPFLSPQHAILEFKNNQFWIQDISELNGVFVRIIEPAELQHGDMIRIGQQLMQFEIVSRAAPFRRMHQNEETKVLGSSRTDEQPWGRLSLINGPETRTVAYGLESTSTRIGREFGDIVFEDDGFISGEHAEIRRENGSVYLEDLGSSNGTYLKIRGRHELVDSDLILMGQQLFQVQLAA